ncbi:MAG: hypothetical protein K8F91_19685, partial [Candidatus Obscuribacterales bacterium]|nr:hypothetical protein [Candidatus Obscuribacterales bacterium]
FMFYPFFLVDKRTGPLKALSASFAITKGARWELLFFLLVLKFIEGICGILLIVGSVAAIMFSRLATTCVYKMLLESTPADLLPAFAGVLIEPQPEPDQDWEKDGPVDADLV